MILGHKLRNTKWRLHYRPYQEKEKRVPERFLEPEWKRLTDPDEILEVFGGHLNAIVDTMEEWYFVVHITNTFFSTKEKYVKLKEEIMKRFGDRLVLEFFNHGFQKDEVDKLTVYQLIIFIKKVFNKEIILDDDNAHIVDIVDTSIKSAEEYKRLKYTRDMLREECRAFDLTISGSKEDLLNRLDAKYQELHQDEDKD